MFKYLLFILIFFLSLSIQGKRLNGNKGILEEYSKVDEVENNRPVTEEFRDNTLKSNLSRAIKLSIQKRYPDFESRIQDLNATNIKFEQVRGTFTYYVKFKEYLFLFKFPIDPELYIQRPEEETILVKTTEVEDLAELNDQSGTNDAKNPKDTKDHSKSDKGFDKFNKDP